MQNSNDIHSRSWQARVLRTASLPAIPSTKPGTLLAVLKHVAEYCRLRDGECWASQQTMASELGLSVSTLRRSLKALESLGVVSCKRKSRGQGRVTHNHYSIGWDKLAEFASPNECPANDQSPTVPLSTGHHEAQEQSEKRQNATTTTLHDVLTPILESVERLLQSLFEKVAGLTAPMPAAPAAVVMPAPVRLDPAWLEVQRVIANAGVNYAQRAAESCRDRGETPQEVLDRIRSHKGTAKQLANHLLHGAALPAGPAKQASHSKPVTAESLWESFCGWCDKNGHDRHQEDIYARYLAVLAKHGLSDSVVA